MKHPLLSFGTAIGTFLITGTAFACSCLMMTPAERYERAEVVVSGTVTAVSNSFFDNRSSYTVSIETSWKGPESGSVKIASYGDSAACGVTLAKGQKYLIYATRGDNGYETNLCSGTTGYEYAADDLKYLRTIKSENENPNGPPCVPYVCVDGTRHPRCTDDGQVINYFAPVCMTHGGEVAEEPQEDDITPFTDVPPLHPQYEAIVFVQNTDIVDGYADGTYRPDAFINRAEFTKILIKATHSDAQIDTCLKSRGSLLTDTPRDSWYSAYLCVALDEGVIGGYPDRTFRPGSNIVLAETAKIVAEAFDLPVADIAGPQWYTPYITALESVWTIRGDMRPGSRITRGDMAEIIWRAKLEAGR